MLLTSKSLCSSLDFKMTLTSTVFIALASFGIIQAQDPVSLNVLFIGNSYTFYHDMPTMVRNLATDAGRIFTFTQRTVGGWSWEDHWKSDETLNIINSDEWDVVILQEFSTYLAQADATICSNSMPYVNNLIQEIHRNSPNALIQFYLTWGRPYGEDNECPSNPYVCDYYTMQDRLTENYSNVACLTKPSQIAPAGEAFRRVRDTIGETEFFELYETLGLEDHHPSEQGSYLAACTHFSMLFGLDCYGNSFQGNLDGVKATQLQQVADATIASANWKYEVGSECTCSNSICDNLCLIESI